MVNFVLYISLIYIIIPILLTFYTSLLTFYWNLSLCPTLFFISWMLIISRCSAYLVRDSQDLMWDRKSLCNSSVPAQGKAPRLLYTTPSRPCFAYVEIWMASEPPSLSTFLLICLPSFPPPHHPSILPSLGPSSLCSHWPPHRLEQGLRRQSNW